MKVCFCRLILALSVIVFAWWSISWAPIALTVIGVILVILSLNTNSCCCDSIKKKKESYKGYDSQVHLPRKIRIKNNI